MYIMEQLEIFHSDFVVKGSAFDVFRVTMYSLEHEERGDVSYLLEEKKVEGVPFKLSDIDFSNNNVERLDMNYREKINHSDLSGTEFFDKEQAYTYFNNMKAEHGGEEELVDCIIGSEWYKKAKV